jgi:cellulose synthase (UDP-forming)
VKEQKGGWRYSAEVSPIDEENKRQYMQVIYDRNHTLPKQMNLWITAYDDLLRNMKKRTSRDVSDKRKLPRIPLNKQISFHNGGACKLTSFNYKYFSAVDFVTGESKDDRFLYKTVSGIMLVLTRTGKYVKDSSEELLTVLNINELLKKGQVNQVLYDLTKAEGNKNK